MHVCVLRAAYRTLGMARGVHLALVPERVISVGRRARCCPTRDTAGVPAVRTALTRGLYALKTEVFSDPVLEIPGNLVVVAVGGAVLDVFLGLRNLYGAL